MKRTLAALSLATLLTGCTIRTLGNSASCARDEPETGFRGPRVVNYSGCPFTVMVSYTDTLGVRHLDTVRNVLEYRRANHGGVYLYTTAHKGPGTIPPGPHAHVYNADTRIIPPGAR